MKILHILNSEPVGTVSGIIAVHKIENEVKVIDLSKDDIQYEEFIDAIFDCDRVFSW